MRRAKVSWARWLVVGADPVAKLGVSPAALQNTFVIVRGHFFSRRRRPLADVVFPAASLYEKAGTVTNTFGDVQLARKAADRAGRQTRFSRFWCASPERWASM